MVGIYRKKFAVLVKTQMSQWIEINFRKGEGIIVVN